MLLTLEDFSLTRPIWSPIPRDFIIEEPTELNSLRHILISGIKDSTKLRLNII